MIYLYGCYRRSSWAALSLVVCLLAVSEVVTGQQVENIANTVTNLRDQKLRITGGINLGSQFYGASGIEARRDAFQWSARANLTFNFAGISAPFSYSFSDANQNFNLPSYTFTGISPTYKWATLHAGDRSMGFSKYTMSGISFRGVGTELRPGKWKVAAFYGKLNRALESDLDAVGNLNGFYQRKGYGASVGYNGGKYSYSVNLFSANDEEDVNQITDLGQALQPINNKVLSLQGRHVLSKRFSVSGEVAHSVYNADKTLSELPTSERTIGNRFFGLFMPTESLLTGQAGNGKLFYSGKGFGAQLGYERITRDFRTIGALFFNNDTENITAGFNKSFLKGKLNTFVNGGLERTNLGQEDLETTERLILAFNANYSPSEFWNFNAGYSNFRNDTKLRAMTQVLSPVDSIFLAQVNRSANLAISRTLGPRDNPKSLNLVLSHQRANSIINEEVNETAASRFTTAALSFAGGSKAAALRYNAGVTFNSTEVGQINNFTVAPTAGLSKGFWNNSLNTFLRTSLSFVSQTQGMNAIANVGLGASYRLKNSHRINCNVNYLNRFGADDPRRNFSEVYGQLGYGYSFGGSLGFRRRDRVATEPIPTQ